MQVAQHLFFDDVRRYYFQDIRHILVERTSSYLLWTILLGTLLTVLLAAFGFPLARGGGVNLWVTAVLAVGPVLAGFIYHVASGPTCRVYLSTGLETQEIGAWKRLRVARRNLALILPLIEEAQAKLPAATSAAPTSRETQQPVAPGESP